MRLPILTVALCLALTLPAVAQEAQPIPPPPPAATGEAVSPIPPPAVPVPEVQAPPTMFYNGGIRMGTSYCVGHTFDCGQLNFISNTIVDAANQCIRTSFGIEDKIMSDWNDESGEFENCVLPREPATNAQGAREWAVCCIKKREESQCDLVCTRYIDQKQK